MSNWVRTDESSPSGDDARDPVALRHVQLVVCGHAHDVDDARDLLQQLGLIEPPGDLEWSGGNDATV